MSVTLATGTPLLNYHVPIIQVQNKANTTPFTYANPELAAQNFVPGSPVMRDATGFTKVWDGTTPNAIQGVSETGGQQLGTNGAGAPAPPFGGITGTGAIQTYPPAVPNQPLGVNIALGTPVSDGRTLFMSPNADNVYEATFDNSAYSGTASQVTPSQADIGAQYGLNKEPTGANPAGGTYTGTQWYVDKNLTGANATIQIVGINTSDGYTPNARVRFVFLPAAVQPGY